MKKYCKALLSYTVSLMEAYYPYCYNPLLCCKYCNKKCSSECVREKCKNAI